MFLAERQLALYAGLIPSLLNHHAHWNVLHARVSTLPHAQGPYPPSFQRLEAYPWHRARRKSRRVLRHEARRARRTQQQGIAYWLIRLARFHHGPPRSAFDRLR